MPIGSAICFKCDPNNLKDASSKENVYERNVPSIATPMAFPHGTIPPTATGSFSNPEKIQFDQSNKGRLKLTDMPN